MGKPWWHGMDWGDPEALHRGKEKARLLADFQGGVPDLWPEISGNGISGNVYTRKTYIKTLEQQFEEQTFTFTITID